MRGKKGQERKFIIRLIIAMVVLAMGLLIVIFFKEWWIDRIQDIKNILRFGR